MCTPTDAKGATHPAGCRSFVLFPACTPLLFCWRVKKTDVSLIGNFDPLFFLLKKATSFRINDTNDLSVTCLKVAFLNFNFSY